MAVSRKELIKEYKEKPVIGGVCVYENIKTGRYLLRAVLNIKGAQSAFDFACTTGVAPLSILSEDWKTYGAESFQFRILETCERKPEQTKEAFLEDVEEMALLIGCEWQADKAY